jgi:peptidoglycan/LPS O-acetylase OafA/YrhL
MATAEMFRADGTDLAMQKAPTFYRPELDALRFCAFLAVYVCHSIPNEAVAAGSQVRGYSGLRLLAAIKDAGNFGVCLFFMLSAFLITELMRREQAAYGHIHVGAFYVRRMLRIWPLYFGITIVYAIAGRYFPAMYMETGRVLAYFLLAGNWYIALHPWIQTPLRSLWSISVEEQFYLLWPLLAKFGSMRSLPKVSIAILPLSLLIIYVSAGSVYAYNTVWLNSFAQFQFFALGALLSLSLKGEAPRTNWALRVAMGFAGLALWFISAYVTHIKRPGTAPSPSEFCFGYLLVAAGCMMMLFAMLGTPRRRIPGWAAYLGKISFGLYVFHETAFLLVDEIQKHAAVFVLPELQHSAIAPAINKLTALCVTIFLAAFSYRFWESPFLRLKQRATWIPSRSV